MSTGLIVTVLIIAAAIGIMLPILAGTGKKEEEVILRDELKKRKFIPSKIHASHGISTRDVIAVNKEEDKIAVLKYDVPEKKIIKTEIFSYNKILGAEIKYDEETITVVKTRRGSQAGGALVGGALLGPLGLIIGGLSGKQEQKTNQKIKKISLFLYIDEIDNPIREIQFYITPSFVQLSDAKDNIGQWQKIIEILIKRADNETENSTTSTLDNNSVVNELTNLVELKKSGAINNNEYESLKKQIMDKHIN